MVFKLIKIYSILQNNSESTGNWVSEFNRLFLEFFNKDDFFDLEIIPEKEIDFIKSISKEKNPKIIYFGNNQIFNYDLIKDKNSILCTHVHTLPGNIFEPYMYKNIDSRYVDKNLKLFNLLFFNSLYQLEECRKNNIEVGNCNIISGFPLDIENLQKYKAKKNNKLIILNQRLSMEKNPTIACIITRELTSAGYIVEVMAGDKNDYDGARSSYINTLERAGANVLYPDKNSYWGKIGEANIVIHFSAFDSFSVAAAEAVVMETKLIAPRSMCYPEFFSNQFLYEPYSIKDILEKFDVAINSQSNIDNMNINSFDFKSVFSSYKKAFLEEIKY